MTKYRAKKAGVIITLILSLIGMVNGIVKAYQSYAGMKTKSIELELSIENEKSLRERNETYFSDYQDSVECRLSKIKCNNKK